MTIKDTIAASLFQQLKVLIEEADEIGINRYSSDDLLAYATAVKNLTDAIVILAPPN